MSPDLHSRPRVKVLLATFNGAPWIDQQLASIFDQRDVDVTVVASDDASSDDTTQRLKRAQGSVELLPPAGSRMGSAHRNFLRLIRDTQLGDTDYVSFSDQDDIWLPHKLARAITSLRLNSAQGYSSNVMAFWPDGGQRLINKAQPQRRYDHLFGSPGPGCTFVLPREMFLQLQQFVSVNFDRLQTLWVHDWLIYAFVRSRGARWLIDSEPTMLYRQHGGNEIGANSGWRAAINRLRRVRSGSYRNNVLAIATLTGESSEIVDAVRRLTPKDRIGLILRVRDCRRRLSECLALSFFFLVMPRD